MSSSISQNFAQQHAANAIARAIASLSRTGGSSHIADLAGNATTSPSFGTEQNSAHAQTSHSEDATGNANNNSGNAAASAFTLRTIRVVHGIQPAGNFPQILKQAPFLKSATPVLHAPVLDLDQFEVPTKANDAHFCCGLWGARGDMWAFGLQIKRRFHLWLASARDSGVATAIRTWNASGKVPVLLSLSGDGCLFNSFEFRLPRAMVASRPTISDALQHSAFLEEASHAAVEIMQGRTPVPPAAPGYSRVEPAQVCILSSSAG